MSDLNELYQEVILDHNKCPRNCRELENATSSAEGYNPLCGDEVKIFLHVEDEVVKDISFQGSGCAIATASASLLTEELKGKSVEEAHAMIERFRTVMVERGADEGAWAKLGKLQVFEGVRKYPMRVKCATLAWHTLQAALDDSDEPVTTE